MYAVITAGGKQHKVSAGDVLQIEKLDLEVGSIVEFKEVLLVADGDRVKVGTPYVDGAEVTAKVVAQGRGEKITIIKFRRRKHYMRKQGHRQYFTGIEITEVKGLE